MCVCAREERNLSPLFNTTEIGGRTPCKHGLCAECEIRMLPHGDCHNKIRQGDLLSIPKYQVDSPQSLHILLPLLYN